jgi:thioredoxin reductase (NADPH)
MIYELLIIGAGPAGISMGAEAVSAGIKSNKILLIEKSNEHSFTIKKYYPENKLVTANYKGIASVCKGALCISDSSKMNAISFIDEAINKHNLTIKYNQNVHKIDWDKEKKLFTIFTETSIYISKTVTIAIGIFGKPNKPDYEIPAGAKGRIFYDITTHPFQNSKILVVGGGDSASEYCQFLSARELNNEIYLSYRQDSFSRMNDINKKSVEKLWKEGVIHVYLNTTIIGLTGEENGVIADFNGLTNFQSKFDYIIYALGGTSPTNFLKKIGIAFNGPKPVLTEGYETNIPGMFLIGDLAADTKGGSILWAFNSANVAMHAICDKYLDCNCK